MCRSHLLLEQICETVRPEEKTFEGRKTCAFDQDRPSTLFEDEASLSAWLSCPVSYFSTAASQSETERDTETGRREK